MKNVTITFLVSSILFSLNVMANIAPSSIDESENPQIINLNMQFKSHNKVVKSALKMPFYQTAELEKTINNKNVYIEVSPRHGKNSGEIAIEMRFYRAAGQKAFAKKEVIAKLGEEAKISLKGLSVKVMPIL